PCDISGIRDYRMIEECGGIQWPFPMDHLPDSPCQSSDDHRQRPVPDVGQSERRLFEDRRFYHADGRARFIFEAPRPTPEPPSNAYPFLLLTGRGCVAQWHTQTRTQQSAVLRKLYPESTYVEINPRDARDLGIATNQWVLVESQRGSVRAKAFCTHL